MSSIAISSKVLRKQVPLTLAVSSKRSFSSSSDVVDHSTYVKYSLYGRQSVSGITATVFGATGFSGRHVVNKLGKVGSQVLIPFRGDGMNTRHMKLMGDLGQIQPVPIDMVEEDSLIKAVHKSNVVVNLLGSHLTTRNYSQHDVNVKCVHRLCKVVKESGVCKRFIHVSALGADLNSPSEYLRTKAEGEEVVKSFFPNATILRPAAMFGQESRLLDNMARNINLNYVMPVVENGVGRVQPLHIGDFAQAVINCIVSTDAPGSTYELAGPSSYTTMELYKIVGEAIYRNDFIPFPVAKMVAKKLAYVGERFAPQKFRVVTQDDIEMADQHILPATDSLGLKDLKIKPTTLESRIAWSMMNFTGAREDYQYGEHTRGHLNASTR